MKKQRKQVSTKTMAKNWRREERKKASGEEKKGRKQVSMKTMAVVGNDVKQSNGQRCQQ